jgi:MEMO1 family protein
MAVQRSQLAGTWYPDGADALGDAVDELLSTAATPENGTDEACVAGIVPHAGYRYSGRVAAAFYRRLRGAAVERAVILAPSHRGRYRGIAVPAADAFESPLGAVVIDPSCRDTGDPLVRVDAAPFAGEHSLEIQLPFLQRVIPGATVVPLLVGRLEGPDRAAAAALLDRFAGPKTAFVVSSDFTHYGRRFGYVPFRPDGADDARRRLRELDMGAIDPILACDPRGFDEHLLATADTICGATPIGAFLAWARGRSLGALLDYATSLDVTGDYEHSVSYAAIGFRAVSPAASR